MRADDMSGFLEGHYRPVIPTVEQVWEMHDRALNVGPAHLAGPLIVTAYTGLRLSEMAALDCGDIDFDRARLLVRHGKGDKPRVVAVLEPAHPVLASLYQEGGMETPMFVRREPDVRWDRQSISRAYGPLRDEFGVPGSWHSLRHFHASFLLDRGASEMDVAIQLGHLSEDRRPNVDLIRRVYGHPDYEPALARLEALAA